MKTFWLSFIPYMMDNGVNGVFSVPVVVEVKILCGKKNGKVQTTQNRHFYFKCSASSYTQHTASDGNRLLLREKGANECFTISYMVWKLSPLGKLERLRLTRNILGMEQQHYRRAHNQLRTKGDTEQSQDAFVLLQNRTSHRRGPIDCIQSPECNLSSSFSNKPSILDGCY